MKIDIKIYIKQLLLFTERKEENEENIGKTH